MGETLIFSVEPLSDPSETSATQKRIKKKKKNLLQYKSSSSAGARVQFPNMTPSCLYILRVTNRGGGMWFVGEGWDQCHRAGDIMLDHAGGSAEKGSGSGLKSEFCSICTEEYHTGAKREERLLAARKHYIIIFITTFITLDSSDLGELFFILAY